MILSNKMMASNHTIYKYALILGVIGLFLNSFSFRTHCLLLLIAFGLVGIVELFKTNLIGMLNEVKSEVEEKGLISYLPYRLREILLEQCVVEIVEEGRLSKAIRAFFQEVAPLFLAKTEEERIEALGNMSLPLRTFFITKGCI
eukprot:maker-scaffold_5-snap-gene-2.44-mRNA-1 protein AED:0.00 eAED:0.00 QI:94/1/1/1/0.66/0.5/4/688/143